MSKVKKGGFFLGIFFIYLAGAIEMFNFINENLITLDYLSIDLLLIGIIFILLSIKNNGGLKND